MNKSKAQNSGWIVITWAWAMGVFIGVLCSVAVTGGVAHLNPRSRSGSPRSTSSSGATSRPLIAGQFVGAFIGAILVYLAYLVHWGETEDPGLKLAVFSTGPAIRNTAANLVTEIIGTFMLVFGVLAIVGLDARRDAAGGPLATGALPVALLVLAIGLALGGPTGYAINPARDLGPRIIHADPPDPWQGWLGLGVLVDPGRRPRSSAACSAHWRRRPIFELMVGGAHRVHRQPRSRRRHA